MRASLFLAMTGVLQSSAPVIPRNILARDRDECSWLVDSCKIAYDEDSGDFIFSIWWTNGMDDVIVAKESEADSLPEVGSGKK